MKQLERADRNLNDDIITGPSRSLVLQPKKDLLINEFGKFAAVRIVEHFFNGKGVHSDRFDIFSPFQEERTSFCNEKKNETTAVRRPIFDLDFVDCVR